MDNAHRAHLLSRSDTNSLTGPGAHLGDIAAELSNAVESIGVLTQKARNRHQTKALADLLKAVKAADDALAVAIDMFDDEQAVA